jgi:hypothetical protein
MNAIKVTIEEGDRQMILLAIAELALSRPGWDWTLGRLAALLSGREMFEGFKRLNADRVKAERMPLGFAPLIAQNDDPELLEWLAAADRDGGGFVHNLAHAGLVADAENYPLIRRLLIEMRAKYPAYEPSDAVKQEIRDQGTLRKEARPR